MSWREVAVPIYLALLTSVGIAALVFGPNRGFAQPWRGLMTALFGVLLGVSEIDGNLKSDEGGADSGERA